jgi:hypothetical protein
MVNELANLVTNELKNLLPKVDNKSVLAIVNGVDR